MGDCAFCGISTPGDLCAKCAVGVTSTYFEFNSVIIDAYVARGIEQIEACLAHHAEFETWLTNHERKP